MRASRERRSLAGKIAVLTRDRGADDAELVQLRRQLDQLRAREVYAWSLSVMTTLPSHDEVSEAAAQVRRVQRSMGGPDGAAA